MIVCGYPCIGKSTVARRDPLFIDLESSHFKVQGRDNTDWYEGYCKLAIELHKTGHVVFTSTHAEVVMYLTARETMWSYGLCPADVRICYPDVRFYHEWVKRAVERYKNSGLEKDRLAAERISKYWENDIAILANYTDHAVPITNPNLYDLKKMFDPR